MWEVQRRQEVSRIVEVGLGKQERTAEFSYVLYFPPTCRYRGKSDHHVIHRHYVPDPFWNDVEAQLVADQLNRNIVRQRRILGGR